MDNIINLSEPTPSVRPDPNRAGRGKKGDYHDKYIYRHEVYINETQWVPEDRLRKILRIVGKRRDLSYKRWSIVNDAIYSNATLYLELLKEWKVPHNVEINPYDGYPYLVFSSGNSYWQAFEFPC